MIDDDNGCCPWCGEVITNPFTGEDTDMFESDWDVSLEAHVSECEIFLAEQGV